MAKIALKTVVIELENYILGRIPKKKPFQSTSKFNGVFDCLPSASDQYVYPLSFDQGPAPLTIY